MVQQVIMRQGIVAGRKIAPEDGNQAFQTGFGVAVEGRAPVKPARKAGFVALASRRLSRGRPRPRKLNTDSAYDLPHEAARNSKLETRNSKLETRNSKLETRNSPLTSPPASHQTYTPGSSTTGCSQQHFRARLCTRSAETIVPTGWCRMKYPQIGHWYLR